MWINFCWYWPNTKNIWTAITSSWFPDFSTSLITLPLWSPAYITPDAWPLSETGCRITAAFNNITVHGSLFAIMTISVDRFLLVLIQYPKYLRLQSCHCVNATIAACWIFALLTVVPQQAIWNIAKEIVLTAKDIDFSRHCLFPPRRVKIYSSTIFLSLYFVPVVLLCALLIRCYMLYFSSSSAMLVWIQSSMEWLKEKSDAFMVSVYLKTWHKVWHELSDYLQNEIKQNFKFYETILYKPRFWKISQIKSS